MSLAESDATVKPSPEEVYQALLRALLLRKGFGLVFVQCSPAKANRLIDDVKRDLPQKVISVLTFTEPIDNLYDIVDNLSGKNKLNILFIQGLEKSLEPYIKPGYGGEGNYYNLDTVPRILSHLNQQRENFRDRFGNICFVFILPLFGIKYFIRRAPDFFDWSSGPFEIPTDQELLEREFTQIEQEVGAQKYADLTQEERNHRILQIQEWLEEPFQTPEQKLELFLQQGNLFLASDDFESALSSYNQALVIEPTNNLALSGQGSGLRFLNRYEEAVESYDKILEIQPDNYQALAERGFTLIELERYEEAIFSYDKLLESQSKIALHWVNRGYALRRLGRDQEAVESYNKALEIEPSNYNFWNQKGILLYILGSYREAIDSYDRALQLKPDFHYAWANRGHALESLANCEEAIFSYDKAIEIKPDYYPAWFHRASALCRIGRSEDGIASYDKVLEIKPDYSVACHSRALALSAIGRYEEAIEGFRKAIELTPSGSSGTSWMCLGSALRSLRRDEESLACFDKAIEVGGKYFEYFKWGGRIIPLLKLGRFREAFVSGYKCLVSFTPDIGFREWLERRTSIYIRKFGLQKLIPVWTSFLQLIGWRVRDW
ncbi:MAG: tetratricopeptide repeat protein [Symploca sp. SIO3E6]|nr:tetratricopeptide repeat protein [Caldora sp. SIO3E6]